MSTAISPTQVSTIVPKSFAKLKGLKDKPNFKRSSSIDTIKRINTYICSPQSYLLPAILTTWLKTSQNGLQSSTEKAIFMFRSLIFGSLLFKHSLNGSKSRSIGGDGITTKLDFKSVFLRIVAILHGQLSGAFDSTPFLSLAFVMAVMVMTIQICTCIFYISQSIVPLGLTFLVAAAGYIVILGYRLNRFYLMKRDVKRKIN